MRADAIFQEHGLQNVCGLLGSDRPKSESSSPG